MADSSPVSVGNVAAMVGALEPRITSGGGGCSSMRGTASRAASR